MHADVSVKETKTVRHPLGAIPQTVLRLQKEVSHPQQAPCEGLAKKDAQVPFSCKSSMCDAALQQSAHDTRLEDIGTRGLKSEFVTAHGTERPTLG